MKDIWDREIFQTKRVTNSTTGSAGKGEAFQGRSGQRQFRIHVVVENEKDIRDASVQNLTPSYLTVASLTAGPNFKMDSSSAQRICGTIVKPIVYGNYAEKLPRVLPNNHSHKWRMFVRPYMDEDMSKYVRKVQFRLHESYSNSLRTIESPPFEIEETGWGEFEASIKIFFVDSNEKPVTAAYYLRLFQPVITKPDGKHFVLYEHYDEIIFVDPTLYMSNILKESAGKQPLKTPTDFVSDKARHLEAINNALREVNAEVDDLREQLRQLAQQQLSGKKIE